MTAWARAILASALALFAGLVLAASAGAAPSFPALTGRVVDDASALSPQTRASLDVKLAALETKTSRQLVVVTVPSLQGYSIEDYGYQLGRAWGIGEKGRNNGVLLIVAPNERRVRVEVGYGLEGVLTDALSSVLLQERVLPKFRSGDVEGGVVAGADALIDQLSLPDDQARARVAAAAQPEPKGGATSVPIIVLVLLGLWVVLGLFGTITGRPGHRMDLWLLPLLLLMSGGGHGRRGRGGGGGFRGGGGSFGGGGASGSW
ncbi:TPM domain-containing protein [Phenylobacterium soli]|uniref:Methanol dehydrogenase n=1 Tax=Phenylobacterium soli TaxID=2170551 RepID=A0A328AHZ5_9CAUL|nr:TPM domain-containing protein [Phenylobacterium soli]RAK54137.1 methanol dehydrogenase [Phenylobacterium soli]